MKAGLLQVSECRIVLLTGLGLMLAPIALMCFFDDDLTLGKASEAIRWTVVSGAHKLKACRFFERAG